MLLCVCLSKHGRWGGRGQGEEERWNTSLMRVQPILATHMCAVEFCFIPRGPLDGICVPSQVFSPPVSPRHHAHLAPSPPSTPAWDMLWCTGNDPSPLSSLPTQIHLFLSPNLVSSLHPSYPCILTSSHPHTLTPSPHTLTSHPHLSIV